MNTQSKIIKIPTLKKKIYALRKGRRKCKIAFTNGCFDILHLGHVSYLEEAKRSADILVVGLNSDRSVRKIKGPKRPIVGERSRAGVLAALACVDHVVLFDEETPVKLIEAVKPDILIKGADWKGKGAVGSEIVRANGGKVKFIKFVKGVSSTNIINCIVKRA
ncbi:MAG: D-glycero-beta-D-manno-heptose 1-phosphate adenylyltransferase [Candidatus Omnitrophica bacterium]|nr:D-glycero-beta-D-manno-heptose 1-phosphate adenylyltransferase [Candidatus Omnitrophota bacterium]